MRPGPLTLVAWWALFVALGCALSPDPLRDFDRHTLPKEAVVHVLASAGAVVGLRRAPRGDVLTLAVLAYCGLSTVSALFAQNPWTAFRSVGLTLSASCIFLAARTLSRERRELLLVAVLWTGTTAAALAVLEAFGGFDGFSTPGRAPSGTFGNRNAMAHVVALCLPAGCWLSLASESRRRRWLAAGFVALAASAIVLSRCRAAWLALAVGLVVGLAMSRKELARLPLKRFATLGSALAVGTLLALVPNDLHWKSTSPYADSLHSLVVWDQPSARGRFDQAAFTLEMAIDAPLLGVGPGNFRVYAPEYVRRARERSAASPEQTLPRLPNDDWLGAWAERGTLAVACLVALLLLCVHGWRPSTERRSISVLGLVTLTVVVCMGALDAVLTQGVPAALAAVVLGTSLPVEARSEPAPILRGPVLPWAFGAVALGSLLRIGVQLHAGHLEAKRPLSVERLERSARLDPANRGLGEDLARYWIAKGDCSRAAPHLERLSRLYPYDRATRLLSAKCSP